MHSNGLELTLVSEKQPEEAGPPAVPDDVWERFARDSERDIRSSAPKEPSARARLVTERLRQQDAREAERSRRTFRRNPPRPVQPEGWRTGPAWREMDGRAARRRRLWAILGIPLVVAVAVVAMKPSLLPGDPFGTSPDAPVDTLPLPVETMAPTAPPSAADSATPTLDRPFAGSPAERWADGAAGIVLPKATPVGSLTEEQVATALDNTKKLLVGANLAPATLRGERPAAAIAVLDPLQPGMVDDVNRRLRTPDRRHDPVGLFSRFDPDEARLVGKVVKTRGRTTFTTGKNGSVAIHADYTFVYPVTPADGNSTEVTRTIVRRVLDVGLSDPRKVRVTPGKVLIVKYGAEYSTCDVHDGFLHPHFGSAHSAGPTPTGPAVDPYDRSRAVGSSAADGCGRLSRT
ncbi:hypothetical protein [Streptomyces sp. NPDC001422]|uniref:hypothetical protein n=1 Tax=Streptomyces sp. NPDC001422 TaxID=3364575 RepID=UPI00367C3884